MMTAAQRAQFDQLRTQVACDKHFTCVQAAISDLCEALYHRDIDVLECLQKDPLTCKFARPFGCTHVCTCPLRKFIAQNFDQWSAESTAVLRQAPS